MLVLHSKVPPNWPGLTPREWIPLLPHCPVWACSLAPTASTSVRPMAAPAQTTKPTRRSPWRLRPRWSPQRPGCIRAALSLRVLPGHPVTNHRPPSWQESSCISWSWSPLSGISLSWWQFTWRNPSRRPSTSSSWTWPSRTPVWPLRPCLFTLQVSLRRTPKIYRLWWIGPGM